MSISQNFPNTRPSLSINFARSQTLDPRITFTRTTSGTRVNGDGLIEVVSANSPRFDFDPVTGECLGLLIEEQKQNLFFYNTKHDEASYWINSASTEIINTSETLSPDGTNNATKLIGNNGATSRQSIYQQVPVTSGVTYTYSVFLKGAERRYGCIWFDSPNITEGAFYGASTYFDLQTGTIATGIQSKIISYPNNWYRIYVTATPSFTGNLSFNLSIGTPNNFLDTGVSDIYKYTGDGVSGFYIWGHQVEVSSFPTSLIYTTNSTSTRTRETAKIEGKNFIDFYNPLEGTVYARYNMKGEFGVDGFNRIFEISDGTSNNRFTALKLGSGNDNTYEAWQINGTNQMNFNTIDVSYNNFYKWVAAYKENDFQRYSIDVNGVLDSNTDTSVGISTFTSNQLNIGYEASSNIRQLNGHISQLTYYPARLSNTQLQNLIK